MIEKILNNRDYSWRFSDRLTVAELLRKTCKSINDGIGFSLIRLGDGEGPFLGWPEVSGRKALKPKLSVWFGKQVFSDGELFYIADLLRSSVLSADVVGLPTPTQYEIDPGYRCVFEAIEHYELLKPSQAKCDANMHWYLQFSGGVASMISGRDYVGIVGCRILGPEIERTFNIGSTETYLVRGEENYKGHVSDSHWPGGFDKFMDRLNVPYPGAVFLIGAGALGKIYCDLVKQKGGVAIDVGSLMDSWAGVTSRVRYGRAPEAYSLEYFRRLNNQGDEEMQRRLDKYILELGIKTATY